MNASAAFNPTLAPRKLASAWIALVTADVETHAIHACKPRLPHILYPASR